MDAFDEESIGLEAEPTREFNTIREISVVSLVFTLYLLTFLYGMQLLSAATPAAHFFSSKSGET